MFTRRSFKDKNVSGSRRSVDIMVDGDVVETAGRVRGNKSVSTATPKLTTGPTTSTSSSSLPVPVHGIAASTNGSRGRPPLTSPTVPTSIPSGSRSPLRNWRSKLGLTRSSGGGGVFAESQTQQHNNNNVVQFQGQAPAPVVGLTDVGRAEHHTSKFVGRPKVRLAASRRGVSADNNTVSDALPPKPSPTSAHLTSRPLSVVSSGLRYITTRSASTDVKRQVTVDNRDSQKHVTVACEWTSSEHASSSPKTTSGRIVDHSYRSNGQSPRSTTAVPFTQPASHNNGAPPEAGNNEPVGGDSSVIAGRPVANYRYHVVDSTSITREVEQSGRGGGGGGGGGCRPELKVPNTKRADRQGERQRHPGSARGRSASSAPVLRIDMPVRQHVTQIWSEDNMNNSGIIDPTLILSIQEFRSTETDSSTVTSDDVRRLDPARKFPFAEHETILPPPELFDTDEQHAPERVTASFPVVEVESQIFLLPPPEEFDFVPSVAAKAEAGNDVQAGCSNDELVLPPPELFDNEETSGSCKVPTAASTSRGDEPEFPNDNSKTEAYCDFNGKKLYPFDTSRNFDSSTIKVSSAGDDASITTGRLDSFLSNNAEVFNGDVEARKRSDSSQLDIAIHCESSSARDRLASDAMDKLDALCRTTSYEVKSSSSITSGAPTRLDRKMPTFTSIPVYHETATADAKSRRRRAVADSWPGGLFFRDHRPGVSVDEGVAKRHSADTSTMMPRGGQMTSMISEDGADGPAPQAAAQSSEVDMTSKRRLFSRYGDDHRDFTSRGDRSGDGHQLIERHRSLEPSDVRERDDVNVECGIGTPSSQKRVDVRSESDLHAELTDRKREPKTVTLGERMFYGERLTALSKTAAVRKNLLEQATERRKGQQVRATSAPLKNRPPSSVEQFSSMSTASDFTETRHSTANISPSINSPFDGRSFQLPDDYVQSPNAFDCYEIPTSLESSSAARTSVEVSRATHRRLRTERSMETMSVSRPASIVLPSSATAISLRKLHTGNGVDASNSAGSPVRVFVDGLQVSGSRHESVAFETPLPPSRSSSSTPIIGQSSVSISSSVDDVSTAPNAFADVTMPPPLAPLCFPESSFDTSSELPSGRNTPSTVSLLTCPDVSNFGLSSPGSTMTDSGIGTSSQQSQPSDRHFIVVAIDFGTTYSGYAFSFVRDPDSVHMMRRWEGGDPGVVNQKTPTTLLLEPNGKFHSFGYAARDFYHDLDAQEAKKWLYFEKFKMALHYNSELNKETTIKAANGRPYSALAVFSHALRFFHDHALEELSDQSATTIVSEDIRWVITVPAIWKAPAKQFMREASYQAGIASSDTPSQLLIALEPEAASIYVRRLRLYQLVPEPPYVAHLKREQTPEPSNCFEHRGSDDEFSTEETVKYRTLPAVHLTPPSSTTITVGHEVDIEGTRYMVVDCGGGTVDITVYEMESRYGCLKELHKATGGPFGSVGVDLEFERLLIAIFGAEFIETFKVKRPAGWVDLMGSFESRKRTASPFKNTPLNVALPFSFIDYHKKCRVGHVENAVRRYGSREVTWSSQGMLRLTVEAMRRLFQPTLDRIKQSIGDVLNHPGARDIRYMFLVGGFSESPMLQLEMRKEFSHLLKIIIPQDVALTILKGAVIFGIDPTVVGVRRSRLTYGVGVLNRFVPGKHLPNKKITRDGTVWCTDVFDRFVAIDQEVAVGDVVVRSYAPARPGQRSTVIHIYCSDRSDIEYVTDQGVRRCGTLCLDLTDALYNDPEITSTNQHGGGTPKNRRREIRARMTFGDTEIRVDAVDVATGRTVRAGIDFLNK